MVARLLPRLSGTRFGAACLPDGEVGAQLLPGRWKRVGGDPRRRDGQKWHGVNYGNRFIPEDWMKHPYDFFEGVRKHKAVNRVALWDVVNTSEVPARRRMLDWLDATIHESHFQEMQSLGVEVLRVPCGYWNWVAYRGKDGPVAAASLGGVPVAERLKNLHRIARPREYRTYFDRIFAYAKKYQIKVLLDLHGLPGSQNGEIHSGACIEMGEDRTPFFESEANKKMAVRAVRAMARYAQSKRASLFGIQVINEPHLEGDDSGYSFLRDYYQRAILAAREFLDASVPIVLFEWSYNMEKWASGDFPEDKFGSVLWDTHLYHFPKEGERWASGDGGLQKAKDAYKWDLKQVRNFSKAQDGRVLVGEFSLAGPSLNREETQKLLKWLVGQFDFAAAGWLLWTFDGFLPQWSMQRQAADWGVDWWRLARGTEAEVLEGPPVFLEAAQGGLWLSAHEDGTVRASTAASWWEEWIPYCRSQAVGRPKLALRSSAHGTWLSVNEAGQVTQACSHDSWEEFSVLTYEASGKQHIAFLSFHGSWLSTLKGLGIVTAMPRRGDERAPHSHEGVWIVS